jgi:phosphohistidine phosphatase
MRHAKSSWDDASLADFERPLNARGEGAAAFMGKFMRKNSLEPAIIISSPAKRAKQTAKFAKEAGKFSCDLKFDERIYEASPRALLEVVGRIDDAHSSAMLVGHNPGIEGFIRLLTDKIEPMPTAALAIVEIDIDTWAKIADGGGRLNDVFRPKKLLGPD